MYKSSNFRKSQPPQDSSSDRFHAQAKQLQEAFPTWSYDDIQSLLVEVGGDAQLASTRIIEGHAEQWGSVTRKKDKKPTSATPHPKEASAGRERGDFRGGRGGRAARGGPRGGAARGAGARGGHHEVNGNRAKVSGQVQKDAPAPEATTPATANGDVTDADAEASAWGSSTPATWGGDTAAINDATSHATSAAPHAPAAAPALATQTPSTPATAAKVISTPATSKLSWAQIARKPQEKPAPPPAPAPQPAPASVPTPPPAPVQQPEPTSPPEVAEPLTTSTGWEEPTTVQAPTWDDEPRASQPEDSATVAAEEAKPAQPEPTPAEEPVPEHTPSAAPPGIVQPSAPESPIAPPPKPLTPSVSARPTPVPHRTSAKFKTTDQPVVLPASFGSGIEKIGMQFGSLSLGGDDFDVPSHDTPITEQKSAQPAAPEPATAPAPVAQAQEPVAPIASPPSQPSLSSAPLFQSSISQPTQQQPSQAQQPPHVPVASQQTQQSSLPTSLTQPSLSTQTSLPSSAVASSISPYSQQSQPSLSSHQSQPAQSQTHHSSYGQHGLPTHLEQVQAQQQQQHAAPVSQQQQPAQTQNLGGPSSYFRQPEAPYYHAPTPPAQSQESPYGAFGQLGQVQHQAQGSHLGNFGGADYGYGESQRNFYDSYTGGPTGFGNRNVLGHDDAIKGLPGSQQPHAAPGLPPASAQSSQQHPGAPSSQASSQGQPSAGQGPQQGYPPPLPYYYPPYPQSQYYGSPYNSGYTVPQPFVKYPTVFQGPPGPQSAPSPAGKGGPSGGVGVQPQSPYGQSLYGHGQGNAYDDIGGYQPHQHQPHQHQPHHQHSVGQNVGVGAASGLPSSEYGKHQSLYGSASQGMQGFIGLGQSSAPSSGGPPGALGQRAAGGSPENAYKPYGANVKDVGAGVGGVGQGGVGGGVGGQVPQAGRGVQQPGQGSFYAQRFAASQASGGPQGAQGAQGGQPQGQGPQGHLGYPQGGSDGSTFYSYQPRQQGGYWQ